MATRIRLRRVGRKKVAIYRIVVADQDSPRNGRFIEVIGSYEPQADSKKQVALNVEKAKAWLAKGATASDTVGALLKRAGAL